MHYARVRIDDRLIQYGQVTTVWSKVANAQRIIICNDLVYNDRSSPDIIASGCATGNEG